jgi:hypothetical protein
MISIPHPLSDGPANGLMARVPIILGGDDQAEESALLIKDWGCPLHLGDRLGFPPNREHTFVAAAHGPYVFILDTVPTIRCSPGNNCRTALADAEYKVTGQKLLLIKRLALEMDILAVRWVFAASDAYLICAHTSYLSVISAARNWLPLPPIHLPSPSHQESNVVLYSFECAPMLDDCEHDAVMTMIVNASVGSHVLSVDLDRLEEGIQPRCLLSLPPGSPLEALRFSDVLGFECGRQLLDGMQECYVFVSLQDRWLPVEQ